MLHYKARQFKQNHSRAAAKHARTYPSSATPPPRAMERWPAPTTATRHERIEFHNHNTLPTRPFQTKPSTLHRIVSFQVTGPFSTATFFPGVPNLNILPHLFDRHDTHLVGRSNFMDLRVVWLLLSPPFSGPHLPLLPATNLVAEPPKILGPGALIFVARQV